MRLSWSVRDGVDWHLHLRLDSGESLSGTGQGGRDVSLITDTCLVRLPEGTIQPSPDARALAALTIVAPWLYRRVTFDGAISPRLAEALHRHFELDVAPVDESLEPQQGDRVGLAYSGGADSIATGTLLPADTAFIHFKRVSHPRIPNRATHLRVDVQAELVKRAATTRDVIVVESDLEFIVGPFPMFPEWTTVAVPVILMSTHLSLGSVAFGTIMGSRYLSNGYEFTAPPENDRWAAAFEGAGLPFARPACGLTEVSTIRLSKESDLASLVRSCLLGTAEGPCLNCKKCLRKELITAGLEDRELDPVLLTNLVGDHPAVNEFSVPPPYYFQHVVEFGLARAQGIEKTFLARALKALKPTPDSTSWTTRYYRPALANDVPWSLRAGVQRAIESQFDFMTADDARTVESWKASDRIQEEFGDM